MKKDPRVYLQDILDSIRHIEDYLVEIDNERERFYDNVEKQDSVIRRLGVIGDATKRLTSEFRERFGGVPWREMAGMRDVLVHEYDEVDMDLVWRVVVEELPTLKQAIEEIIRDIE